MEECAGISVQGNGGTGAEHRAHLGVPRGSIPCLLQGKEHQTREAELFYTQICNSSLMLFFAQSKKQAA